ncbi:40S ribosomal protein S19 [Cymbomonas tetramitiformis]|uniref:40S ribosomal protein S19 n=1 Tax=Cymbomonas tetramitiformis TaxID=36881 RepID=A0AAE0GBG5_9CHLO|nr:40S ribosomal protein S19 [Cymbomonas tetramitiformis]
MAAAPKTVKDVPSHEFVVAYAQYLRSTGKFETPTWVDLVKTSVGKEMAPYDPDWYYIRAGKFVFTYVRDTINAYVDSRELGVLDLADVRQHTSLFCNVYSAAAHVSPSSVKEKT